MVAHPPTQHHPDLHAEITIKARSGQSIHVRHMRREDAPLLERMFYKLSSETRWRRFFVPLDNVDPEQVRRETRHLAHIDPDRAAALLATVMEDGREEGIAVARYGRIGDDPTCAEASIVVRDDYQGAGIGVQVFDLLVQVALARGIHHMVLLTHADNLGMIGIVHKLGLPYSGHYTSGLYEIDLQLTDNEPPVFPFSTPQK
ncbi:GCN5-related N-acetyltransferase [Oscillochloris trichoides DG-6]|uniref:GCN5-related N-acetyltransferase n=1 Tax=Oscillochloris trichoides DG-6 TaxID=765420 RepID=E1IBL1_9CHLR|nr:GNAT family N-acetyltransferase [Oscillochloris trichoides]EFO81430.1 GCN5-related N-acetyltransferase [Oscillochloris trichoides DG-6]